MRLVELRIDPRKVQITQKEILADLRYPAPSGTEIAKDRRR